MPGLLVAGDAGNADRAAEQPRVGVPEIGGAVAHHRQHRHRHPEQVGERLVPASVVDIKQKRARGVGRVGHMHAATG
jgi:hypothetical protein